MLDNFLVHDRHDLQVLQQLARSINWQGVTVVVRCATPTYPDHAGPVTTPHLLSDLPTTLSEIYAMTSGAVAIPLGCSTIAGHSQHHFTVKLVTW